MSRRPALPIRWALPVSDELSKATSPPYRDTEYCADQFNNPCVYFNSIRSMTSGYCSCTQVLCGGMRQRCSSICRLIKASSSSSSSELKCQRFRRCCFGSLVVGWPWTYLYGSVLWWWGEGQAERDHGGIRPAGRPVHLSCKQQYLLVKYSYHSVSA